MKSQFSALLVSIFIISACGGGGGGGSSPVMPSVTLQSEASVDGGSSISITASINDPQNRITSKNFSYTNTGKEISPSIGLTSFSFTAPKNYKDESITITYSYNYNAQDNVQTSGSTSKQIAIKAVIPDIPSNFTYETGSQSANVFWTASEGANKYTFYYSETSSTVTQSDSFFEIEGNERDSVRIIKIPNDIKSTYAVTASNAAGESGLSETFAFTTTGPAAEFTNQPNIGELDLSKFDLYGNELPDSASSWACVKDNTTGIMWEVKIGSDYEIGNEGLQDMDDLYTYYDSSNVVNGSNDFGDKNSTSVNCSFANESSNDKSCNSEDFITAMNTGSEIGEAYCGRKNWKLPNQLEFIQLLDLGQYQPDFPSIFGGQRRWNQSDASFWTRDSDSSVSPQKQIAVNFDGFGVTELISKSNERNVRAVSYDDNELNSIVNFEIECFELAKYTILEAKEFVSNKVNQTGEDWRWASIRELAHFKDKLPVKTSEFSNNILTSSLAATDSLAKRLGANWYISRSSNGRFYIDDANGGTGYICLSKY